MLSICFSRILNRELPALVVLVAAGLMLTAQSQAKPQDIDVEKSYVQWTGKKVAGQHTGKVKIASGTFDIEAQKGELVVNMDSIVCEDLSGEWKKKLEDHLRADDFFTVSTYKTSRLKISEVKTEKSGKAVSYKVKGDLTIKDKTQKVDFKVELKDGAYVGRLVFDRTKFGVVYKSGSLFKDLGDKLIYDDVELDFHMVPKAQTMP